MAEKQGETTLYPLYLSAPCSSTDGSRCKGNLLRYLLEEEISKEWLPLRGVFTKTAYLSFVSTKAPGLRNTSLTVYNLEKELLIKYQSVTVIKNVNI